VLKLEEDWGEAKDVASLGFILLLISFFALLWVGSYWEVWAFSVLSLIILVEGIRLYVKKRRLQK
jgi:hypothetical protein